MAWAKWQTTGNSTTKLVLLMHADYARPRPDDGPACEEAGDRHYAWSGQTAVAEACEMSVSSVKRHEQVLVDLGLIRKVKRFSRAGNRLTDFVILAVNERGPCPFPDEDPAEPEPADPTPAADDSDTPGSTRCQIEPLSPPAERTKCQSDLRSPVTPGPKLTGEPYKTVVLDGSKNFSLSADPPNPEREIPTQRATPPAPVDVEALVDAALARFPTWSRTDTRRVIRAELADGRPPDVITRAWPVFLTDPDTKSPNRFKYPRRWWEVAYGPTRPPRVSAADCPLCDPAGWLVDDDHRPIAHCTHPGLLADTGVT